MSFRVRVALLFTLIYPFYIFGEESIVQTEILLSTVDYEPEVEHIEAEAEGENGITTSYKVNGVEVDVSTLESVIESIHERISRESIFINKQQQVISNFVGSILDSKGVEYDNLGTKLVVKELSPELIAELTQNFFFIEGIEENVKTEEETAMTLPDVLNDVNIDPLGFIEKPSYWISSGDYSSGIDVGIMMQDGGGDCPDTSLTSIDSKKIENYSGHKSDSNQHAAKVTYILQKASEHAYIYCENERDYTVNPKDKEPKIYVLNQSFGKSESSYIDRDKNLDNFIFDKLVASFKSGGNGRSYVTSPGKAYNTITVSYFTKDSSGTIDDSFIVSGVKDTKAQKPEIVANGLLDFPTDLGGEAQGSSLAAPLVASGFGANLISQYPIFRYQPQLLKAFLMTISQNITGGDSPINEKEGAGTPDYENTFNFMRSWWNGTVEGWFKSNGSTLSKSRYLKADRTYRIAISWLVHGDYTLKYKKPYLDFDLYIKKDGKEVKKSERDKDTFELIEFTPTSNGTYTFEIKRAFYDSKNSKAKKSLYLGLAFTEIKK
jgi:hypothetical protein